MTGIELLLMIKEEMIEEGTEINVFKIGKDRFSELITVIMFIDNELKWAPGTFRNSMLWNDKFYFKIAESKTIPDKVEKLSYQQLGTYQLDNNDTLEFMRALNGQLTEHGRKINELIDVVNKIQNKDQ